MTAFTRVYFRCDSVGCLAVADSWRSAEEAGWVRRDSKDLCLMHASDWDERQERLLRRIRDNNVVVYPGLPYHLYPETIMGYERTLDEMEIPE